MSRTLVAFFSATGATRRAAENLAEALEAGLWEIRPAQPYTGADLNWRDKSSRSSREMSDPSCRPALAGDDFPEDFWDTLYLGFPIWWYTAPRIINTFLESHDFTGKKIVLFATSGGSGLGNTAADLAASCPGADLISGGVINGNLSVPALKRWAQDF